MSISRPPRCPTHGTVLNPEGKCTLCERRQEGAASSPASASAAEKAKNLPPWAKGLAGGVILVLLVGIASVIFSAQRDDDEILHDDTEIVAESHAQETASARPTIAIPPIEGRRAHFEASYARRVTAVSRGGGSYRNLPSSAVYFSLIATQRVAEIDSRGRISAYEYQISSLRVGTAAGDAQPVLSGAVARVQPRPNGRPVIEIDGERLERRFGGTYEAFVRLTPVFLGVDENGVYGFDADHAAGERWPMHQPTLRRMLQNDLHLDNAELDATVALQTLGAREAAATSRVVIRGARPRRIDGGGTAERYEREATERLTLPTQVDGRRDSNKTITTQIHIREAGSANRARLFQFEIVELVRTSNVPLD